MTTCKEVLYQKSLESAKNRFWKLRAIKAPRVMLIRQIEIIRELEATDSPPYKDFELFSNLTYESDEIITGRGGKKHVKVTTKEKITFGVFNGPYSRFCRIWKDEK